MANTEKESTESPRLTGTEAQGSVEENLSGGGVEAGETKCADEVKSVVAVDTEKTTPPSSGDTKPTPSIPRPSLVQLGSSLAQGSTTTPHPKRFSAVNINKKFLETTSTASASSPVSQGSLATKAGGASPRPQVQPSPSHSRLVTAKLTSTSPSSSASGVGWSRPSSVAPPSATGSHSPNIISPTLPVPSATSTSTASAPQLPHAGKVIQPQPRAAAVQEGLSPRDAAGGGSKPVWGNVRPTATSKQLDVRNDFPTAAEVAQVATTLRMAKLNDSREAAETAAASKQARLEEADTFRGVHLDPKAHHWDEMEEDDDNFLDGVIEFGDGRQYKIESTDTPSSSSLLSDAVSSLAGFQAAQSKLEGIPSSKNLASTVPVSKEERFADDFDRSWPRSRTSPATSIQDFPPPSGLSPGPPHAVPVSPVTPHGPSLPPDGSRVLFNERSNRLEPYSSAQRPGPGQHPSKRATYQEQSVSPTEPRFARDASHNVQLLQKSGSGEPPSRFRRGSGGSTSGFVPASSGAYNRERDYQARRDGPPPSPHISNGFGTSGKDRDFHVERGRRSDMGPPPLPAHAMRGPSRDGGRQLPPHLSQMPPNAPVLQGRISSYDSKIPPSAQSPARLPSQSPALSHASAARISPAVPMSPLPQLSAPELEEVRKDVMQSAAARAKQRRQQEEEEREKEKERARRKAAEIEERIKAAAEAEKTKNLEKLVVETPAKTQDEQVITIIEEAVKSVQLKDSPNATAPPQASLPSTMKPNLRRPPSLKGLPSQALESVPTTPSRRQPPLVTLIATSSSSTTTAEIRPDSWRRANPLVPPTAPAGFRPAIPAFHNPPQSALDHVESLASNVDEDLEVVDFSDMGKFVGVSSEPAKVEEQHTITLVSSTSSRAVASDFFDKYPRPKPMVSAGSTEGPWRQNQSPDVRNDSSTAHDREDEDSLLVKDYSRSDLATEISFTSDGVSTVSTKEGSIHADNHAQTVVAPHQLPTIRTPRSQAFYKEAAMSALDDAMSRIKGALDGMQAVDTGKESHPSEAHDHDFAPAKTTSPQASGKSHLQKERWIHPALRLPTFDHEPREVFHVTGTEPPRSPKPAWNSFVVRLPTVSQPLEFIDKRQLFLATKPIYQVRWDILSFDPPVEGMNRKHLSLNEVLFRKPFGGFRGKPKYQVLLPRYRSGPRVNMPPPPKANGVGAFGRPAGADGVTTWRKTAVMRQESDEAVESGLSTMSRSPPPDIQSLGSSITSITISDSSMSTKDGQVLPSRSRLQPKMPAGSAVAFYRDSRIDAVEEDPKPSVNFIVNSELESKQASQDTFDKFHPGITVTSPPSSQISTSGSALKVAAPAINGLQLSSPEHPSSVIHSKAGSKSSDDSIDRVPITPPSHHSAPWARASLSLPLKESPARGPDPEHLKAVWSQTSNKAGLHGVNSLEGIADDLTALPFTIQDVKSEDGETPPPSVSAAPSRMSLHDVTRAFQQVPSSSSSSSTSSTSHRTPPSAAPPIARPSSYAYGLPPSNNMRPAYSYPSPMMSHSPGPAMMYPHPLTASPIPSRMPVNGHTPLYSQPMWVSMPPGPNPQNHGSMMRPMTSPYPTQLMPYPSPGTPAMYAPQPPANMQTSSQQGGQGANRDRNMSMMSPVMSHSGPAMYGSPVLMHAPVMQVPSSHGYMVPAGRGQSRSDNGQIPMHQGSQQPNPSAYNPIPPSPFMRSAW